MATVQVSVTPAGKIHPCCGVLPFHEDMAIGDLNKDSMSTAITRAYADDVMKWIAFEGPVALLRQITADTEQPLHDEDFDGICTACDRLFSSPDLLQLMRAHLPGKKPTLALLEEVYGAVNFYRPAQPPEDSTISP